MNRYLAPLGAAALALTLMTGTAFAQSELEIAFADAAWTGDAIPEGQQCPLQDGEGATPALDISGVPEGTTEIHVAFNDETYTPMDNGGHGTIGFEVTPEDGAVSLPSVPGATEELPEGVFIAVPNATSGDFTTPGYMPPCSGGQGNTYSADVTALDGDGNVLASGYIVLGTY